MPETKHAAVITGGSGGIGKALLNALSENFEMCFNLDTISPEKPDPHFVQIDISNIGEVKKSVDIFTRSDATLKAIILSAGIGIHEKIAEGDPVKWKRVIDTNLLGPLNVLRAFLPFMQKGGDVIFVSSVAANQPYEYGGIYAATKTALNIVAETLRLETDDNLRVSIVEPGLVKSHFMQNTISGERDEDSFAFDPMSPDTIAKSVKFILEQPEGISLNNLTIRPSGQKF